MNLSSRSTNERALGGRQIERSIASMYSDDPVDEESDVLDRKRLASQLARAIRDVSNQTESAVVSIVGPWGSGKTSLLNQIKAQLTTAGWHIGVHNPWSYSDYVGAVAGFFSTLRDAVPDDVLDRDWRQGVSEWVSRVAPLGALGGVVGVDASGPIGAVGAMMAGDRSPEKLREQMAEGLKKLERPVLVVLDDLDRLAPDELLFTFKLIRLLGRLPHVYYLIAYDEKTLTELLESTDLVGSGSGRAQQYLEKIVQVRLEIPPLLPDQQASLVEVAIDEICRRHNLTLSADESQRLQRAWQACLSVYLDQPRSVKRLFTQVDATWPDVAGEVDFADFVVMTFLRTFERRILDLVVTHRNELLRHESPSWGSQHESPQDRWQRWIALIESAEARHPSRVADLLAELFLYLRGARDNTSYDGSYQDDIKRRLGAGTSEHFDRYVQIGVPASDIPQSVVRQAVEELQANASGPGLEQLTRYMETEVSTVMRKLIREHEAVPISPGLLLPLLGNLYYSAMDQKSGPFGLSPEFSVLNLAMSVLDSASTDNAARLLKQLANANQPSLALAADVVQKATQASEEEHPWVGDATEEVISALETALRSFAAESASNRERLVRFLYAYRWVTDPSRARELVWELIDDGVWQLNEILGLLIPLGQARNGEESWPAMREFSEGSYEELLGIDALLERLPAKPELVVDRFSNEFTDKRVDPDDLAPRIEYALASLERVRRERGALHAGSGAPESDH